MTRILVSGSRVWRDRWAFHRAMVDYLTSVGQWDDDHPTGDVMVIHGAAKGLDTIAKEWVDHHKPYGVQQDPHPVTDADWNQFGSSAGPRRNAHMVSLGADVLLAFPLGISKGTRGCIELAEKADIPIVDHDPALTAPR